MPEGKGARSLTLQTIRQGGLYGKESWQGKEESSGEEEVRWQEEKEVVTPSEAIH